jgi:hypothetical protein
LGVRARSRPHRPKRRAQRRQPGAGQAGGHSSGDACPCDTDGARQPGDGRAAETSTDASLVEGAVAHDEDRKVGRLPVEPAEPGVGLAHTRSAPGRCRGARRSTTTALTGHPDAPPTASPPPPSTKSPSMPGTGRARLATSQAAPAASSWLSSDAPGPDQGPSPHSRSRSSSPTTRVARPDQASSPPIANATVDVPTPPAHPAIRRTGGPDPLRCVVRARSGASSSRARSSGQVMTSSAPPSSASRTCSACTGCSRTTTHGRPARGTAVSSSTGTGGPAALTTCQPASTSTNAVTSSPSLPGRSTTTGRSCSRIDLPQSARLLLVFNGIAVSDVAKPRILNLWIRGLLMQ